jgi:hypothetical protein
MYMHIQFLSEHLKGRSLGRSGRGWDNRMNVKGRGREGMDLIRLAQNRDQWRALVNTVMNILFT